MAGGGVRAGMGVVGLIGDNQFLWAEISSSGRKNVILDGGDRAMADIGSMV